MCVSFPTHRNNSCRNRPNECVINPIVIRAKALSIRIMKLISFAAFIHDKKVSFAVLIKIFCNKLKQILRSHKGKLWKPWKWWLVVPRRYLLHPYNLRVSKSLQDCMPPKTMYNKNNLLQLVISSLMLPWDYKRNQDEDWSIWHSFPVYKQD